MRNPHRGHAPHSTLRKFFTVAILGLLAAAGRPLLAANSITNIQFTPASPATVSVYTGPTNGTVPPSNQRVNVTVDYTTTDTNGVAVFFDGTNFASYSGSNFCGFPSGTCSGWFTATAPATVTSLAAHMTDFNNSSNTISTTPVSVNYTFTSSTSSFGCVASATTLCIDDQPGDKRYQVQASYSTSRNGGQSGSGHAIPLAGLGVTHGGVFWFFSADNPELLFKVLNTCSFSPTQWVFASAGTDVGVMITLKDLKTGFQKTYTNTDLTPMQPIQDTSTLPCS